MLIERAGRRLLLAASGLLVSLSMAGLATYLSLLTSVPPSLRWLPLPLVVTTFVGFSVGLATIPLSLIGEILPARYVMKNSSKANLSRFRTKNICGPVTSFFNLLFLFLVLKNYVNMAQVIGYSGVYW